MISNLGCFVAMTGVLKHDVSMSILPSKSIDDFNSLNYMRKQSNWTIQTRRFMQRLFGAPQNAPDDAPHGLSPPGM